LEHDETISYDCMEAAFDEAVICLDHCKDMLIPEEVERLAHDLEASYEAFVREEAVTTSTKSTKNFTNVIIRNQLSTGFLIVTGYEIIGGDLTVGGNEFIAGNLYIQGVLIS